MSAKQKFTVTCEKSDSPNYTISNTETGPASYAVINALAEIKETELADLKPLYSVIDPDALDRLFQHTNKDDSHLYTEVSFSYEGHDVTITPVATTTRKNPIHPNE